MPVAQLLDLLEAREGIVALVGAGGKKTTLYRLAAAHEGPVAVTTTVRMAPFPAELEAARLVDDSDGLAASVPAAAERRRCVAYAAPGDRPGRMGGVAPEVVARLHRRGGFRATLVKADGARMRWLKCPRDDEPRLPAEVATVTPVVSARAIGRPLDERTAHRPAVCAARLGLAEGEAVAPRHVAALLGQLVARCREGGVRLVPVINMVDGPHLAPAAWEAGRRLLDREPDIARVILATMNRYEPLVGVVER